MITSIKTKEGEIFDIVTQQYIVGLYGIINGDPKRQFSVQTKEVPYHKKLRSKAIKRGDEIIEDSSSIILDKKGNIWKPKPI